MKLSDFNSLDSKTRTEVVITSVMVLVLIIILVNSIRLIFKSKNAAKPASYVSAEAFKEIIKRDATAAVDMNQDTGSERYQKAMKKEDSIPWGRDPFSEKDAIQGGDLAVSDLKLEGVLFHYGNVPRAIINGELVGEGDKIGTITVVKISKDDVIVTDGDKDYKLQLWYEVYFIYAK